MIFIELVGGKARRLHLEFHPHLTVVDGLGPKQRWDLGNRLARAIRGEETGFEISVDVDGTPEALDAGVVERIAVGDSVDNVIGIEDIPGVEFYSDKGRYVPIDPSDPDGKIAAARIAFEKAELRATAAARRMEIASKPAGKIDEAVLQQLAQAHREVSVRVGETREQLDAEPLMRNSPEKRRNRRRRLEDIEAAIERRIKELRDELTGPGPRFASTHTGDPAFAERLLGNWKEVNARLAEAKPVARAPRWLVAQVRNDVQAAREAVQQLMIRLGNGEDVFENLESARSQLRDFEALWSEVESSTRDEIGELQARRASIFEQAIGLAGREIEIDELEEVLDELAGQPRIEPLPEGDEDEFAPIRRDLAAAVLDLRDVRRDLTEADIEPPVMATAEDEERVAGLLTQLREAEERERELGERLAELQVAAQQPRPVNPDAYEKARVELARARDAVTNTQRMLEHVVLETPQLSPGSRRPFLFDAAGGPLEVDMSRVDPEELKIYVLSRASAVRRAANGQPVPLIIDSALDELPDHVMFDCLKSLMQAASVVQVIYLAGDRTAVEWAYRQDEMRAAVTRMGVV